MQAMIFSLRQGTGKNKAVFIHGNTGSHRWWQPVMAELAGDFDMLAVDLRGFGLSPDGPPAVTLADHANDIDRLCASLGFSDFILVGHSLGGGVAMQFAADYPDKVSGLVLADPSPVAGLKVTEAGYAFLQAAIDSGIMVAGLKATFAAPVSEEYFADLTADCRRSLPAVIANTRALAAADFTAPAKAFAKPVLVVYGEQDTIVPRAEAEKTAAAYPRGGLAVISGVGHNPQVEKPAEFAGLLRSFAAGL